MEEQPGKLITLLDQTKIIAFFSSKYACSNHYPAQIYNPFLSLHFPTSEHNYMFRRAEFFQNPTIMKQILETPSPKTAKTLAASLIRTQTDADMWSEQKLRWMSESVVLKFAQDPLLAIELAGTTPHYIVDCARGDTF